MHFRAHARLTIVYWLLSVLAERMRPAHCSSLCTDCIYMSHCVLAQVLDADDYGALANSIGFGVRAIVRHCCCCPITQLGDLLLPPDR